ncbi:hypothetical protein [Streptomyces sp. NPDC060366]
MRASSLYARSNTPVVSSFCARVGGRSTTISSRPVVAVVPRGVITRSA